MKVLKNYPDINFIENMSLEEMQKQLVEDFQNKYKEITGTEITLAKADPARLILYAAALQLYQGMQYIDSAAKQSFLKYSYGSFLENLGALKGITRNQGEPARTTIRFTLSAVQAESVVIPMGTRITPGNNLYYYTEQESVIPVGEIYADVEAVCAEIGEVGNGYEINAIKTLVDKLPYMESAYNVEKSSGGAEIESDENLAERIYLAPSSYSVAGPDDAYKYWVKAYNPSITDVKVWSPEPGKVDIRFVVGDGELPEQALMDGVEDFLMESERRPLTDLVSVGMPDIVKYNVRLKYWINDSDKTKAAAIQKNVDEAVKGYIYWQKTKIGRDINPSMLNYMLVQAGAKRTEIEEPVFTVVGETGLAIVEVQKVIMGGIEDD